MAPMTRHKHTHTGLVTQSPLDRWIGAMLRVFAMLVFNVASTLQMTIRRPPVNATRKMPAGLLGETSDTYQETRPAAPHSQRPIALMVSSTHSVRLSNHEGVLTTRATPTASFSASCRESELAQSREDQLTVPLVPTKVGTQGSPRSLSGPEAALPRKAHHRSWIPAFAGMRGNRSAPDLAPI
jgi:hypothetical protein